MRLLVLGRGKTGTLVADVGRERGHQVQSLAGKENQDGRGLTHDLLKATDVVIDFTTPYAVVPNIIRCAEAGTPIVVGTTGWYQHIDKVRELVRERTTALLYGSNFFGGMNFFFIGVPALAPLLYTNHPSDLLHRASVLNKNNPAA